jgi:hypothetical protein
MSERGATFASMDTYRVISDVSSVPEMAELQASYVGQPARRGDCFDIDFSVNFQMNPTPYEPAVGARCRVIRERDGAEQECGGAVRSVVPLSISLDGAGLR